MWQKLSFIAFAFSLCLMLLLYFQISSVFGITVPRLLVILGVFVLGFLGFVFSVISIISNNSNKNTKSREQILSFHIGMVFIFFGLVSRMLFWPFSNYFFISGLLLIAVSYFFKNKKTIQDDDILDG